MKNLRSSESIYLKKNLIQKIRKNAFFEKEIEKKIKNGINVRDLLSFCLKWANERWNSCKSYSNHAACVVILVGMSIAFFDFYFSYLPKFFLPIKKQQHLFGLETVLVDQMLFAHGRRLVVFSNLELGLL